MFDAHDPAGPLVVFGGASGIGLATARLASVICPHILIADVADEGAELELVRSGAAHFVKCDATVQEDVEAAIQKSAALFGRVGAVVTTVGGSTFHDPLDVDLAAWRREITFNLETAYLVATTAARQLMADGGGSIVLTSSSIVGTPRPERLAYGAAKAGVIALTKGMALSVAAHGVRVNCVAPGTTDTPRMRALVGGDEVVEQRMSGSPQKKIAVPEDVAQTILFLASNAALSTTGQVFWVNNGVYMP